MLNIKQSHPCQKWSLQWEGKDSIKWKELGKEILIFEKYVDAKKLRGY